MKMIFHATFLLFLLGSVIGAGTFLDSGKLSVQFDPQGDAINEFDWECRYCFKYYLTEDRATIANYRHILRDIYELDSNGATCCQSPSRCPFSATYSNCNQHGLLYGNPPDGRFRVNATGFWVNITAQPSSEDWHVPQPTPNCPVPGDSTRMCVDLFNSNELVVDQRTDVVTGDQSLVVPPQTMKSTYQIRNWRFAPGSKGLRFLFAAGLAIENLIDFTLFPEIPELGTPIPTNSSDPPDYTTPCTGVCTTNFTQINILSRNRENQIFFTSYALVDGVSRPIKLTGPYAHPYDLQTRVFLVDVPRFNTSVEYTVYSRVKQLGESSRATQDKNPFLLPGPLILGIIGGGGGLIICCCLILIIYKVRNAVRKVTHKHSSDSD